MHIVTTQPAKEGLPNEGAWFWPAGLQDVLHALRTPLTAIIGFAELLQMQSPRDDQLQGLDAILRAGVELSYQIDRLVDERSAANFDNPFSALTATAAHSLSVTGSSAHGADLVGTHHSSPPQVKGLDMLQRNMKLGSRYVFEFTPAENRFGQDAPDRAEFPHHSK